MERKLIELLPNDTRKKIINQKYHFESILGDYITVEQIEPIVEEDEIAEIVDAIYHHSDKKEIGDKGLRTLIAKADRMSRACFACQAAEECKWSEERKNCEIVW